ncbi:hypothetical protein A1D31_11015 [Bradyrhizobium liaoningense]|nr:hypothetical protein A1D31_11015 [Bradyrhizobium liaoningense]
MLPKLDALLGSVMAWLAKALEIVGIKEQGFATLVRPDVIGDGRRLNEILLQAKAAQRLAG